MVIRVQLKKEMKIMKKIYSIPQMTIVKIQAKPLLLPASDPTTGTKFDPNGTTSTMESRGFSFFDDDEDDEY